MEEEVIVEEVVEETTPKKKVKLVKMVSFDDESYTADVHPEEVDNWKNNGWKLK